MNVSVKPLPKLKKKAWTSKRSNSLGSAGEQRAAAFLISLGFHILCQNIRVGSGELDIVSWDPNTLEVVIVEVKTRHQNFSGDPGLAVDRRKLIALLRAARAYMREIWKKPNAFRIDVIAVSPGKIQHYKNVSWGLL